MFTGYKEIKSSNLSAVDYDPQGRALKVRFKGSGEYLYVGVPQEAFENFMASESKGSFFHSNIKGVYEHEKIEKEKEGNDAQQ